MTQYIVVQERRDEIVLWHFPNLEEARLCYRGLKKRYPSVPIHLAEVLPDEGE